MSVECRRGRVELQRKGGEREFFPNSKERKERAQRSEEGCLPFSNTLLMSSDSWNRLHEAGTKNLAGGIVY